MFVASVVLAFLSPRRRLLPALAAITLFALLTPALQAAVGPTIEQFLGSGTVSFLRRDEGTAPFPLTTPSPEPSASGSVVATPFPTRLVPSTPPAGPAATTQASSAPLTAPPTVGSAAPISGAPTPSTSTSTPRRTFLPTALPTSPPEPSHVSPRAQGPGYLQSASDVATDRYGFNDRIFIDVIALRLWRADALTLLTGIGLEAFPLLALSTELAEPIDIHSSYVWLPVEMGLAGIIALATILGVLAITGRRLWFHVPRELAAPLLGVFGLYLSWWTVNEGLYQRSFWLFLCLAAVITRNVTRRANP
jgi:hypothetical protein